MFRHSCSVVLPVPLAPPSAATAAIASNGGNYHFTSYSKAYIALQARLKPNGYGYVTTPFEKILSKSYYEIIGVFICWCNLLYKNKRVFHMAWHFIQSFTDPYQKWKGAWPRKYGGGGLRPPRIFWGSFHFCSESVKLCMKCHAVWKTLLFLYRKLHQHLKTLMISW